jgi:hypothetical protein
MHRVFTTHLIYFFYVIWLFVPVGGVNAVEKPKLTVTTSSSTTITLPADGKSVGRIRISLTDAEGKPSNAKVIKALIAPRTMGLILNPTTLTANGEAEIFVQSGEKPGIAAVTITAPGQIQKVDLKFADPLWKIDVELIAATLGGFILAMLLLSIGAEKMTDVIKAQFYIKKGKQPKERLATLLGTDFQELIKLDDTKMEYVWALMKETTGAAPQGIRAKLDAIIKEDQKRQEKLALWAWQWRLWALVFGLFLAGLF